MKLQDVILKAMAKKLSWIEAAEIAGMSVRTTQRKREAYQDYGYTGLFDHAAGKEASTVYRRKRRKKYWVCIRSGTLT